MSKLSDDIKKYVQGDYLTGEEYGKWGCLNRVQRKDINKLCELCDMFEKSADNFYKENLQKDQRIAELEKENKRLNTKLEIWNRFDKEDYIHGGEKATERDYYYYTNGVSAVLENEVKQLKSEQNKFAIEKLEELKQRYYETIDDCGQLNYECELNDYGMFIKLNRMIKELKGEK